MRKSIIDIVCVCLAFFSFNVSAALVNVDWQTSGDNLVTRDTVSGLDWLDLTVTVGTSVRDVSRQLLLDSSYSGWRYAVSDEVVKLWQNFDTDLSPEQQSWSGSSYASNIPTAISFLGDTYTSLTDNTGVMGMTLDFNIASQQYVIGGYLYPPQAFYTPVGSRLLSTYSTYSYIGSYLVRTSPVPIPAALWLFGSGLIGLIGIARRKV